MFSGAWRESHERTIHMKIPDDNIDQQGKNNKVCLCLFAALPVVEQIHIIKKYIAYVTLSFIYSLKKCS